MSKILIFMRGKRNSQLIYNLLKNKFEVEVFSHDDFSMLEKPFKLLIVDDYYRIKNNALLKEIKNRDLVYLPFILLSENENLIQSNSPDLDIFDEMLKMPVPRNFLLSKIDLLLKYRENLYESYNANLEKEDLIKKIHKKMYSNLETITSLLYLQANRNLNMSNMEFCDAIASRIKTMTLAHEQVYLTENNEIIPIKPYIISLTEYLKKSTNIGDNIMVNLDIEDIYLDIGHIIPCGLILNEIFTNSIKYGFPNRTEGNINIMFKRGEDNRLLFTIEDDGIGIPFEVDVIHPDTLGLNLIKNLSEEIEGELKIYSSKNLKFVITLNLNNNKLKNELIKLNSPDNT